MSNIKVQEILHKHGVLGGCIYQSAAAIKEIVKAVVEKCAENASHKHKVYDKTFTIDKNSILQVKNMVEYE